MPDSGVPSIRSSWIDLLIQAGGAIMGLPWNARWRTPWSPAAIGGHHHRPEEQLAQNSQNGDLHVAADRRAATTLLTTSDGGGGSGKFHLDMSHRSHATLQSFFAFNPTFGHGEDEEHKKLLYYYPPETAPDDQLRDIGVAQGLVNFTKLFSPDKPCEVLHTQKTRQVSSRSQNLASALALKLHQRSEFSPGHL